MGKIAISKIARARADYMSSRDSLNIIAARHKIPRSSLGRISADEQWSRLPSTSLDQLHDHSIAAGLIAVERLANSDDNAPLRVARLLICAQIYQGLDLRKVISAKLDKLAEDPDVEADLLKSITSTWCQFTKEMRELAERLSPSEGKVGSAVQVNLDLRRNLSAVPK